MPKKLVTKKKTPAKAKPRATRGININKMTGGVVGNIRAKRVIVGNQTNYYDNRKIAIATPQQFIAEAEKLQAQIAQVKQLPALPTAQAPLVLAAEQNVQMATAEAKKDKPNPNVINENLKTAAATMDLIGKTVAAAQGVGQKITQAVDGIDFPRFAMGAATLGDLALKVFNAIPK
ncbi:MAG: hypothetical protein HY868_25405 [Chloroflexi bacterium]|nr:hypothetical protein [Chloroflexota bacterium]